MEDPLLLLGSDIHPFTAFTTTTRKKLRKGNTDSTRQSRTEDLALIHRKAHLLGLPDVYPANPATAHHVHPKIQPQEARR